jgi:hypothetical protein
MSTQKEADENAAMEFIAMQAETQRLMNNWPHIIRVAAWPNLDNVIVAVAASGHRPIAMSLDLAMSRQFRDNISKTIGIIERGEHRVEGGGYPPPASKPHRDN